MSYYFITVSEFHSWFWTTAEKGGFSWWDRGGPKKDPVTGQKIRIYYSCDASGMAPVEKNEGIRKQKESVKIDGTCPCEVVSQSICTSLFRVKNY